MLSVKQQRSCTCVSFSTQGLFSVGLDKVRNDFCLYIWDAQRALLSKETAPTQAFASAEAINSMTFFHQQPNELAVGVGYKWIRVYDVRDPTIHPLLSCPTKYVYGLSDNPNDSNQMISYSEDCEIILWDRRYAKSNSILENCLNVGRVSSDKNRVNAIQELKFSPDKCNRFAGLSLNGKTRVWDIATLGEQDTALEAIFSQPKSSRPRHEVASGDHKYATGLTYVERSFDCQGIII